MMRLLLQKVFAAWGEKIWEISDKSVMYALTPISADIVHWSIYQLGLVIYRALDGNIWFTSWAARLDVCSLCAKPKRSWMQLPVVVSIFSCQLAYFITRRTVCDSVHISNTSTKRWNFLKLSSRFCQRFFSRSVHTDISSEGLLRADMISAYGNVHQGSMLRCDNVLHEETVQCNFVKKRRCQFIFIFYRGLEETKTWRVFRSQSLTREMNLFLF